MLISSLRRIAGGITDRHAICKLPAMASSDDKAYGRQPKAAEIKNSSGKIAVFPNPPLEPNRANRLP
jgi:hypothetical protein